MRKITFGQAINEALSTAMEIDPSVVCFGLGIDDPKGVFGTTLGLQQKFGPERVFDMPTSENGMTGVAVGAALNGIKPVLTHQRLDFALLSMDQIVNNAAKWNYMFGGQNSSGIVVRMILGRGWGQGPTHSQNLQSWFAHIPGLKCVMPASAADAKGLLLSAIFDPNPVIFLEHRWLHNVEGEVPAGDVRTPIGPAKVVTEGKDLTLVTMSYMTIEALHAVEHLQAQGVSVEHIDLRSVNPIDWPTIFNSVKKTGRLLVCDTSNLTNSVSGEIVARIATDLFSSLKAAPQRLAQPDIPSPTSPAASKHFYKTCVDIVGSVESMLGKSLKIEALSSKRTGAQDVPGDWFKGPF